MDELITWEGETTDGNVRWSCSATREQLVEMRESLDALLTVDA